MRNINLEDLKFENVQESFGMGGPYLGALKVKGKSIGYKFLADNARYSKNFQFILLVEYRGESFFKEKFLGVFTTRKRKRDFRIILIDTQSGEIFQSHHLGEALYVESMVDNKIHYFVAFHNGNEKFRRVIEFNEQNFNQGIK